MCTFYSLIHEKLNMQDTGLGLYKGMMFPAQKEFTVQFIKRSISNQPHMKSELSSSGQQKQLKLTTMDCKHQSQTLATSLFCESGPGRKGKIMARKLLCKSRKSLTHVAVQTTVRSFVKAKDNSLG